MFFMILTASFAPSTPAIAAYILGVVAEHPQFACVNPPCYLEGEAGASGQYLSEYPQVTPLARSSLQTLLYSMYASHAFSYISSVEAKTRNPEKFGISHECKLRWET